MPIVTRLRNFRTVFSMALLVSVAAVSVQSEEDAVPPRGGMGEVSIITDPPRAMVYLGGAKLGLSPVDTSFASGRHTLTIMYNGEELITERVNVWPDRKLVIERKLVTPYGSVTLTTKPEKNVRVSIDGEPIGETEGGPLRINNIEAGSRIFTVTRGKAKKQVEVKVIPEENVEVHVDLN